MKRQNILHDEKGLILKHFLNVNHLGGSGSMLPWKILKLRSSKIAGNVYFFIYFYTFKVFKEGNQVTWKEALCPSLWKVGVRALCAPCAPRFLRPLRGRCKILAKLCEHPWWMATIYIPTNFIWFICTELFLLLIPPLLLIILSLFALIKNIWFFYFA